MRSTCSLSCLTSTVASTQPQMCPARQPQLPRTGVSSGCADLLKSLHRPSNCLAISAAPSLVNKSVQLIKSYGSSRSTNRAAFSCAVLSGINSGPLSDAMNPRSVRVTCSSVNPSLRLLISRKTVPPRCTTRTERISGRSHFRYFLASSGKISRENA